MTIEKELAEQEMASLVARACTLLSFATSNALDPDTRRRWNIQKDAWFTDFWKVTKT